MEKNNLPSLLEIPRELPAKKDLKKYVNDVIQAMDDTGTMDLHEVYARVRFFSEVLRVASTNDLLLSKVGDEILKADDNILVFYDRMKIHQSSTGARYDYSNDHVWAEMQEKLAKLMKPVANLKKKIYERENFLQMIGKNKSVVYDDEGTAIEKPIITSQAKSTVVLTYK